MFGPAAPTGWPTDFCPPGQVFNPQLAALGMNGCTAPVMPAGPCPPGLVYKPLLQALGMNACVAPADICPMGAVFDPLTRTCQVPGGPQNDAACAFGLPYRCSRAQWDSAPDWEPL